MRSIKTSHRPVQSRSSSIVSESIVFYLGMWPKIRSRHTLSSDHWISCTCWGISRTKIGRWSDVMLLGSIVKQYIRSRAFLNHCFFGNRSRVTVIEIYPLFVKTCQGIGRIMSRSQIAKVVGDCVQVVDRIDTSFAFHCTG